MFFSVAQDQQGDQGSQVHAGAAGAERQQLVADRQGVAFDLVADRVPDRGDLGVEPGRGVNEPYCDKAKQQNQQADPDPFLFASGGGMHDGHYTGERNSRQAYSECCSTVEDGSNAS